jgi:hypothetical protein
MKKALVLLAVAALALAAAAPAFSQARRADPTDAFVKTVPIAKIYTHVLGYRILYFKSTFEYAEMYVPIGWFKAGVEKAEIIQGNEPSYPYFTLVWADGKFDHVRLYVRDSLMHPSWGELTAVDASQIAGNFNVQGPPLDF